MRLLGLIAGAIIFWASAAVGADKAAIVKYGRRSTPGVVAQSGAFEAQRRSKPQSSNQFSSSPTQASPVLVQKAAGDRCSTTRVGQSLTFSMTNGVDCASFDVLLPGEPRRGRKGKKPKLPSAADLAAALFDRAVSLAPDPQLQVAPSRVGLAGLRSYFWLANPPRPIVATASAGPTTVTAVAVPTTFVWDFGDGRDRATRSPGRAWQQKKRGSIGHLYQAAGRFDIGVTVNWSARWRSGTGPWLPLGSFSTSDARPYAVREILAWLTRRR